MLWPGPCCPGPGLIWGGNWKFGGIKPCGGMPPGGGKGMFIGGPFGPGGKGIPRPPGATRSMLKIVRQGSPGVRGV